MFLNKYLNDIYIDLLYDTYNEQYINNLDEENFKKVYTVLKKEEFYFIDDIILKYLEIFEIDSNCVLKAINDIREILGSNYVKIIGNNLSIMDKIIELSTNYSLKKN